MSQPCTAIELLLVDVRALESEETRAVVMRANELSIACGLLSLEPDVASAIVLLNMPEAFDFWFGGNGSSLPLERAVEFLTVTSPRVMLISDDAQSRAEASERGIHPFASTTPDLERTLG